LSLIANIVVSDIRPHRRFFDAQNQNSLKGMEELAALYEELNAPSATAFRKALAKKGIPARARDVEEFVKSRTERQVIAPPPKYKGHIVSFDVNHRWMADLIAFTSRPVKTNDGFYTHVLLVEDVFSRYIWARPLQSVSDTTRAFAEILKESEDRMVEAAPYPQRLDTDGGPEWNNASFKSLMARYKINHVVKDTDDRNAIATVDRAIGTIKRALKRREIAKGGNWLSNLDATVAGYNKTEHGAINTAPTDMTDDVIFSLRKEAAENFADNSAMIQKRQDKLEGGYRVHIPGKGGLKRRTDANTWSSDIHQVSSFPAPGIVQDTDGIRTLTKLTRPVPADSSATARTQTPQHTQLEPYAHKIRDFLGSGMALGQTSKEMKRRDPQFPGALKANKTSFKEFVQMFPKLLRVHDGKIYPRVNTL
jgi:hypothetical protein